jgi:ATP-dependent protease ClpP protease subunit
MIPHNFLALLPGRIFLSVVLVVVSALFPVFLAQADVRILSSPGGAVDAYLAAFSRVRQSGERVIIDGPCLSACTLVLSTIPRNRICVTRRAVLGFHAPRWYYPGTGQTMRASEATRVVTASYPQAVSAWIKKRGGLTQKVIYLRGKELAALYRRC